MVYKYNELTHLRGHGDAQKVHKPNVLVSDDFHLVNESEPTEIVSQLLLCQSVVKTPYIDIPARVTLADSEPNLSRDRRRFAPTNL
jgi:hypothetical protein